jgi:HAD superfamily hydrolase (TIGR01490 family)
MTRVGAFFDVDRTLVACNTGRLFLKDLRKRGEISFLRALRATGWMLKYHLSLIDLQQVANAIVSQMRGVSERDFADQCRRWVENEVLPLLLPAALRQIEHHREQGHMLALLSSSPTYVTRPIAETLGLDETISTQLEVSDGQFTGKLLGPACYGAGKVHWADKVIASRDLDASASYFYTDSYSDLPMLERIGHQMIVNPDPRLRRTAKRRGWAVQNWIEVPA